MTMKKPLLILGLASLLCSANGQWQDIKQVGQGGEPTVTHDGKGTVYLTCHLNTQVFVSRDWGANFTKTVQFDESLGDMLCMPLKDPGEVLAVFMPPAINGMLTRLSTDYGKTWKKGEGIMGRPLDREWTVQAPDGTIYMVYSDGYIGGPPSKGCFIARSSDKGMTWKEVSRFDDEEEGGHAVDPHIAVSATGRLYAYWASTEDLNTLSAHKVCYSDDGGKTWRGHTTIDVTDPIKGNTQERWMLGGLAAFGEKTVVCYYVAYRTVGRITMMNVEYRRSDDGGKSWGAPVHVSSEGEASQLIQERMGNRLGEGPNDLFHQCVPWACFDPQGKLHIVWYENRSQKKVSGTNLGVWHLRHSVDGKPSERVSGDFAAYRPPMDFISCAADEKYVYVTWVETPDVNRDMVFSGNLWFGRKELGK